MNSQVSNLNLQYYPPEIYNVTTKTTFPPNMQGRYGALQLDKTVPYVQYNGGPAIGTPTAPTFYPVWRLATTTTNVQDWVFRGKPSTAGAPPGADSGCLQPYNPTLPLPTGVTKAQNVISVSMLNNYRYNLGGTVAAIQNIILESTTSTQTGSRFAYFTQTPINTTVANQFDPNNGDFYLQGTTETPGFTSPLLLQPGCYAVVGPHRGPNSEARVTGCRISPTLVTTSRGSRSPARAAPGIHSASTCTRMRGGSTTPNMVSPCVSYAATASISATGLTTATATYPNTNKIKFPLGIPLASSTKTNTFPLVGLNISEPKGGYLTGGAGHPAPTNKSTYGLSAPQMITVTDSYYPTTPSITVTALQDIPFDAGNTLLTSSAVGLADNTYPNTATVLLQRLADPTQSFNPYTNPYLTVDWMPVDLTVFNGHTSYNKVKSPADKMSASAASPAIPTLDFVSKQRGPARAAVQHQPLLHGSSLARGRYQRQQLARHDQFPRGLWLAANVDAESEFVQCAVLRGPAVGCNLGSASDRWGSGTRHDVRPGRNRHL